MQYKVLALDLDGTLTNNAKVITPRTKAALQAAADRRVRIVTGAVRRLPKSWSWTAAAAAS